MNYISTRDNGIKVSSGEAIVRGLSRDSGLFVPESIPKISFEWLKSIAEKSYQGKAEDILSLFLTDFAPEQLRDGVKKAYNADSFGSENPARIAKLGGACLLELWHGPTRAFKDMALQLLPHLLTAAAGRISGKEIVILAATSGDTGKAALEGFKNVPGTRILVFYPRDGVSRVQELQMTTQDGHNVAVMGVNGNFDDAQAGVKKIFADSVLASLLEEKNFIFSSANSINWGRLVPQIIYYFSAYCDLVKGGEITIGEKINVCVPTGNFGNILAAYYAKEMGLPVGRLICASNSNNVLTDFIREGIYDRRRALVTTSSPSMDILVSSNLERLLFNLSGNDSGLIAALMSELDQKGMYAIPGYMRERLESVFWGGFCSEENTARAVRDTFSSHSYLCDTHTAVAIDVYGQYVRETGDNSKAVIVSTADPYKFAGSILNALTQSNSPGDEFEAIRKLHILTGIEPPGSISDLEGKRVRFPRFCSEGQMPKAVEELILFRV